MNNELFIVVLVPPENKCNTKFYDFMLYKNPIRAPKNSALILESYSKWKHLSKLSCKLNSSFDLIKPAIKPIVETLYSPIVNQIFQSMDGIVGDQGLDQKNREVFEESFRDELLSTIENHCCTDGKEELLESYDEEQIKAQRAIILKSFEGIQARLKAGKATEEEKQKYYYYYEYLFWLMNRDYLKPYNLKELNLQEAVKNHHYIIISPDPTLFFNSHFKEVLDSLVAAGDENNKRVSLVFHSIVSSSKKINMKELLKIKQPLAQTIQKIDRCFYFFNQSSSFSLVHLKRVDRIQSILFLSPLNNDISVVLQHVSKEGSRLKCTFIVVLSSNKRESKKNFKLITNMTSEQLKFPTGHPDFSCEFFQNPAFDSFSVKIMFDPNKIKLYKTLLEYSNPYTIPVGLIKNHSNQQQLTSATIEANVKRDLFKKLYFIVSRMGLLECIDQDKTQLVLRKSSVSPVKQEIGLFYVRKIKKEGKLFFALTIVFIIKDYKSKIALLKKLNENFRKNQLIFERKISWRRVKLKRFKDTRGVALQITYGHAKENEGSQSILERGINKLIKFLPKAEQVNLNEALNDWVEEEKSVVINDFGLSSPLPSHQADENDKKHELDEDSVYSSFYSPVPSCANISVD